MARYALERVSQPVLTFTPDGRPRIASAQFYPLGSQPAALTYLAPDDACDSSSSWAA